jgi:hypothetical protein
MITAMVIDATKPVAPAAYPPRAIVPASAVDAADIAGIKDLVSLFPQPA